MRNKLFVVALALFVSVCFLSCDLGTNEWSGTFPRKLRGTWTYNGLEISHSTTASTTNVNWKIEITKDEVTSTATYTLAGGGGVYTESYKGRLASGMGPIKSPDGDYYMFTLFTTSSSVTGGNSFNAGGNAYHGGGSVSYISGGWDCTINKKDMKYTYEVYNGNATTVSSITFKKE